MEKPDYEPYGLLGSERVVVCASSDFKNKPGFLFLTNSRVLWCPQNDARPEEIIQFTEIKSTLVSNGNSKRVCLKLVTPDSPLGCLFYFTASSARTDLDTVKDNLTRLMRESRNKDPQPDSTLNSSQNGSHSSSNELRSQPINVPAPVPASGDPPSKGSLNNSRSYDSNGQNSATSSSLANGFNSLKVSTDSGFGDHEKYKSRDTFAHTSPSTSANSSMQHSFSSRSSSNPSPNYEMESSRTRYPELPQTVPTQSHRTSIDDDFFGIQSQGPRETEQYTFDVEVRDPQKTGDPTNSYMAYEVVANTGLPQYRNKRITQRRRYKDFEWLAAHLTSAYQHRCVVPALPAKSLLGLNRNTMEFTQKRCRELDIFLKQIVRHPVLRMSKHLQSFIEGEAIHHESGVAAFMGIVENQIGKLTGNTATEGLSGPEIDIGDAVYSKTDIETDYNYVRMLMSTWSLTPKLPFEKFMTVVLGTTSAGKSAFVNHFYGVQVKRSAIGQMDTAFTLVETLPREKFAEYSNKMATTRREFTDEELSRKISGDVFSDPRHGYVFLYLDTFVTLSRYEAQFTDYAQYISNYSLVRSIIINEDYLRGDPAQIELAKRTLVLDSPGFDPARDHASEPPERFLGGLRMLQLFFSMSDLALFMMPATQINMVAGQIATLELSVLYSLNGASAVDRAIQDMITDNNKGEAHLLPSINDMKNFLVNKFMGPAQSDGKPKSEYNGTVVWDKMRFVITKIDEVFNQQNIGIGNANLNEQYYELGRLLGKHLTFLEPPTYAQTMAIGLPEHQRPGAAPHTGDLASLLGVIKSLNSETSYMARLEASIQTMCLELKSAIKASWYNLISPKQWMSSDDAKLDSVYRRSCGRLKRNRSGSNGHSRHVYKLSDDF